jgi:hypothetical protein
MARMFILGSRCLGRDLAGAGFAPLLREGGSLRECPNLKIKIWGTQTRGYLSTRTCGYLVSRVRGFMFSRMKVMVDSSGVPGPKMAETPFSFNLG